MNQFQALIKIRNQSLLIRRNQYLKGERIKKNFVCRELKIFFKKPARSLNKLIPDLADSHNILLNYNKQQITVILLVFHKKHCFIIKTP